MKKALAALLALMMILTLSACGGKSDDVTGKYLCVSAEVYGDSAEPDDRWLELKKGGKGTFFDGYEFDLEWKLDGETFTGTVSFMGMENSLEGTLKDGVLNAKYGDYDFSFAKEGVQAGSDVAANNGIAGEYTLSSATIDGTDYTLEELRERDMVEGTYLILNKDGSGELCFADDEPDSFTYDENAGEIVFQDGETWPFTVDGHMITFDMEDAGTVLVFAPKSDAANSASASGTVADHSNFFGDVTVASTMDDAFAGASSSGSGFVSETTSFEVGSRWYGTLALTNYVGANNEDTFVDAYGVFGKMKNGDTYFEIYLTEDHSDDSPALSYFIDLHDDYFVPIIGNEDAWIFSTYLTDADTEQQTTYLYNGALVITFPYSETDPDYSCDLLFYLREEGAEWDEENDLLPPGYDDYKAKFGL